METKDPALTKTPMSSHDAQAEIIKDTTATHHTEHSHHALIDDVADDEVKGTQVLQETIIGSNLIDDIENLDKDSSDASQANHRTKRQIAGESVTHEEPLRKAIVNEELAKRDGMDQNTVPVTASTRDNDTRNISNNSVRNHDELEAETSITNNTDTFKDGRVGSEHVNEGDDPARQPDRRDQQGSTAFDEGINEETVGSEAPKSEDINDRNRYASIDNAQSRVLAPDQEGDESITPKGIG